MTDRLIKAHTARTLLQWPSKAPGEALDYGVDWSETLPKGDGIKSSKYLLPPGLVGAGSSNTATEATVTIAGGDDGRLYSVIHSVRTEADRVFERVIKLRVRAK